MSKEPSAAAPSVKPKRTPGNRMMGPGYARALRVFVDGPASWHDIAKACNVARITAQSVCHGMNRQRLIHISRWELRGDIRRHWTPVYVFGDGVDAARPSGRAPAKSPVKPELLAFCYLVKALQADSWHKKGLAEHLGHGARSTRGSLAALRALRLIHIDDYVHRSIGGFGPPMFTWGPDTPDEKKKVKTKKEVWTSNNAAQRGLRQQMLLMRAVVLGAAIDGRTKAAKAVKERQAA